ncbi:MAG TPA: hypothetical protein VF007_13550 [Stellaceae bacterium]
MDKKIAALLGAVAGAATVGSAQAATGPIDNASDPLQASSYADLLTPVPNAVEALKADDARAQSAAPAVQLAQYYPYPYPPPYYRYYHHHHHHHHAYWRRYRHHHHHHHHHHHNYWGYYR